MKKIFALSHLLLSCLLIFSCESTTAAKKEDIQREFDFLCQAQQEFLASMKEPKANEKDLKAKRDRKMIDGVKTKYALLSVNNLGKVANKQEMIQANAELAGLKGWKCAAFFEGP